jgi:hypothetical protein
MDTATTDFRSTGDNYTSCRTAPTLNVEILTAIPFQPGDHRWAIRFNADETVTIVIGARNFGGGWFSAYFAGLASARLGIPFHQFRLYYTGNHPAALHTPSPPSLALRRGDAGPFACAVAEVIEALCEQVIEKGRMAFAAMAGVGLIDVGFDQTAGRYFVMDRGRSGSFLEIAASNDDTRCTRNSSDFPDPAALTIGRCNE